MTQERVQIPAYTDRWMMGDRYGNLVKITKRWAHDPKNEGKVVWREIAHVKLDHSGIVFRCNLDDCTLV